MEVTTHLKKKTKKKKKKKKKKKRKKDVPAIVTFALFRFLIHKAFEKLLRSEITKRIPRIFD